MLLQVALNGPVSKDEHPNVPVSPGELARDAADCVAAGARAMHFHPRDADGRETVRADVVDDVVRRVRDACGVPVGVTTGDWIEPDLERRLDMIRQWHEPDFSSVNLAEAGADRVMAALLDAGIGIEAGISYVADVELLAASGLSDRITRVLVEPVDVSPNDAIAVADEMHRVLDAHGITAPRLQHGDNEATWVLIDDAKKRGCDTRIGLEDTRHDPDGNLTAGNEELVRIARDLFL